MKNIVLTLAAMLLPLSGWAQDHQLDINLKKAGAPIPSTLYGIFFEDINYAADGGLYAELVKNRSFEFPNDALQGWKAFGKVEVRNDGPFERNPHYVRLQEPGHPQRWTGLDNEGFFGIGVEEGKAYRFSVWARVPDGGASTLRVELANTASMGENHFLCQENLTVTGKEWKKYQLILHPAQTLDKSILRSFRTVSWHVQQLYGRFRGSNCLSLTMNGANVTGAEGQDGLFASAVLDGSKIYVKVVNTSDKAQDIALNFTGLKKKAVVKAVEGIRLSAGAGQLDMENSLDQPAQFQPASFSFQGEGKCLTATAPAYSFSIYVLEK